MYSGPPPAYPDSNAGMDPMADSEELNIKHTHNFHFSEETIRKGYISVF